MESATTIKKKSNNNAVISIVVFLLVAGAISTAVFGLYSFKQQLQRKEAILEEKDQMIAKKDSAITFKDQMIETKAKILYSLHEEINELGDSTINIQCSFRKLTDEYDPDGRQLWHWNIWLKGSVHRLNQINKVYYKAQGAQLEHQNRASVERSNGFLVSYEYFNCLESIRVTIQFDGGNTELLYLNVCERFKGFQVERFIGTKEEALSLR